LDIVAKTIFGLENILAEEIKELGGQDIVILNRAVSFKGDKEVLYKVNLWSRAALRVLVPLFSFTAHNETVLYKRIRRYDWSELLDLDKTFAITSTVNSDIFNHSLYISLKVKDAIVDQFRENNEGQRPSIDLEAPDINLHVHCNMREFTISLDSSGDSLHRRKYRQEGRLAPLNEALASSMILLSEWDKTQPLYDPMCGSGTILTEAVMIAQNIAPRLQWTHFGFMNWSDYDPLLWHDIYTQATEAIEDHPIRLYGSDIDADQIRETQSLIDSLQFNDYISLEACDFFSSSSPCDPGVIITNPPYDLRVQTEDIDDFYKSIGDTLKQNYQDWDAWILSGNKDALKRLGLRTSRKLTLYNGSIECKYQKYEMYRGSKKAAKLDV
jgi:putative N6-adenine-specific DNA methylase